MSPSHVEPNNVENLSGVEEMNTAIDMNGISGSSCALELLQNEGQTSTQKRHECSNYEDSAMSNMCDNVFVHVEENHSCAFSCQEARRSEELDSHSCSPGTSLPFTSFLTGVNGNVHFQDDSTVNNRPDCDTEIACTSENFAPDVTIPSEDSLAPLTLQESEMSVRSENDHAGSVPMEEYNTVVDCEIGKKSSLMALDGHLVQELCAINIAKREHLVAVEDVSQVQGYLDNIEENKFLIAESEQALAEKKKTKKTHLAALKNKPVKSFSGKGQLKRKTSYQPLLSPFKNLLMSKHSRKKLRK